jgi:membrane-associated HD superfamily phosphohydrolase
MADDAAMPSLSTQVTWIVVGYAVLVAVLAVLAVVVAVRRHERPSWLDQMVWMLELLLVVRALVGLGPLLGEDRPDSTSTYVGYLISSVCVLPIAMKSIEGDRAVWSSIVVAVAAVAIGVIAIRLEMTA